MRISILLTSFLLLATVCTRSFGQSWIAAPSPPQHAIAVEPDAGLAVTFLSPIDTTSLNDENIVLRGNLFGSYLIENIAYHSQTRTLSFGTAATFLPGETVTVTLTTGITDSAGASMPAPFQWSFTIRVESGTGLFTVSSSPAVGSAPWGLTLGDLDRDGDLDLATANRNEGTASLLFNNGTGSFPSIQTLSGLTTPEAITAADLDDDGDLDLAITNAAGPGTISLFRNEGGASFVFAGSVTADNRPHAVAASDLDGDGDLDLVISNLNSSSLSILRNDGPMTFIELSTIPVASAPELPAIGDLDLDGDPDLAVPHFGNAGVELLYNNGGNDFTLDTTILVGTQAHLPTAADLNGDGNLDILVPNFGSKEFTILENLGAGQFNSVPASVSGDPWATASGDFDSDGDLDFVIANYGAASNNIAVWINAGNLIFNQNSPVPVGDRPHVVVAGDLDGDGDLDLATANEGASSVSILKNNLATDIGTSATAPDRIVLHQNYPNPFNPVTTIRFELDRPERVMLAVYSATGSLVTVLVDRNFSAGGHSIRWNGTSAFGTVVGSGIYICHLVTPNASFSRKMIFLK